MVTHVDLTTDDLQAAMSDVLAVLDLTPASGTDPAERRSAAVTLQGESDILLVVQTTVPVAAALASAFFGLDEHAVTDDDVADALGELANMAGGAVKPLLGGTHVISVPDRSNPPVPDGQRITDASVPVGNGQITVVLSPVG